jgi:multidrug resistance efflux pump
VIRSPVNGYVTNLLARLGDYAKVGTKLITVVDADSFWVDGYFEETSLAKDRAMRRPGNHQAHAPQPSRPRTCRQRRSRDTVPNAQPGQAGLASVNPIFTWVRLAQRVPVRIDVAWDVAELHRAQRA